MRHWDFWGWVAYGLLAVSVSSDAVESLHKKSAWVGKILPSIDYGVIAFSFFIAATVVFMCKELGWLPKSKRKNDPLDVLRNAFGSTVLTQVIGGDYKNETVEVDGREYINCTFKGVTFAYEGRLPFRLTGCTIDKPYSFRSSNPAIAQALEMSKALTDIAGHTGTTKTIVR